MSVRIVTLGDVHCYVDGQENTVLPVQRLRCAVLVYLAYEREVSRDVLLSVFWPERDEERARHALSQTIYELRRALGEDWLEVPGDKLCVTREVELDALEFECAAEAGKSAALESYGGPFLQGFILSDARAFDGWSDSVRAKLSRLHRRERRAAIEAEIAAGDIPAAARHARRWADIEPLEDEAHHRLIELLLRTGQSTEAREHYDVYDRLMRMEDLEPLDETKQLMTQPRVLPPSAERTTSPPAVPIATDQTTEQTAPAGVQVAPVLARRRTYWGRLAAAAAVVMALGAGFYTIDHRTASGNTPRCADGSSAPCALPTLDPHTYVVLPLNDVETRATRVLDGAISARLLAEGLGQWDDVKLADQLRINDALQRHTSGERPRLSVDSALVIAQSLGAGKLIMGEIWQFGDTARIEVTLYDVAARTATRTARARLPQDMAGVVGLADLADSLLLSGSSIPRGVSVATTPRSLEALRAFDQGEKHLSVWNLQEAADAFRKAVQEDSAFAYGHLRLSQVLAWKGDTLEEWRTEAARAAMHGGRLMPNDRMLALAGSSLSARKFPDACRAYESVVAVDPLNSAAWIGLGDCRAWDNVVVADTRSISGWAFRSSYQAAASAYQRALAIVPSFNFAFGSLGASRLRSVLFVEIRKQRVGHLLGADSTVYRARPALLGDTLTFIPYSSADLRGTTVPPTSYAHVDRARSIMRDIAVRWVHAFPRSADAYLALADALERLGEISDSPEVEHSAIAAARRAIGYTALPEQRFHAQLMVTRLQLKDGDFDAARRGADSLLANNPQPSAERAPFIAGLAALRGHPHRAATLMARSAATFSPQLMSGYPIAAPLAAKQSALALLAYASFCAPVDSINLLRERVKTLLLPVDAKQRDLATAALLDRPLSLAFPVLGLSEAHVRNPAIRLLRMQTALAQHDGQRLASEFAALDSLRSRANERAADFTFNLALLRLGVHDTAGAVAQLDGLLQNLRTAPVDITDDPVSAAALVRAFALRARLAAGQRAPRDARRWAGAVLTLWQDADPELQPILDAMKTLERGHKRYFWQ